jgi:streptomycin 6-kinase
LQHGIVETTSRQLSGDCLKLAIEVDASMLHIHPRLAENQVRYHGDAGRVWLEKLPSLAKEITRRWQLKLEPSFTTGMVDYVTPVVRADGSPAVLKLCFVYNEFVSGVAALRAYDGRGAVRLLEVDVEAGALLLERLDPGEDLTTLHDEAAEMRTAAEVMRELWKAPSTDSTLLRLDDWVARGNLPTSLPSHKRDQPWIDAALRRVAELLQDQHDEVLLHGDLHFENVLSSARGWLAIDPKGIVGDPAWELAPLLINKLTAADGDWRKTVRRRIDQLIDELALEPYRAYAFSAVRALQSRFWSLRDDSPPGHDVIEIAYACAEELSRGPA